MMDFLRALAPTRDGDAQRAMPLLSPRFSGLRPLSSLPIANSVADGSADIAHALPLAASAPATSVESAPAAEPILNRLVPPEAAPAAVRVTDHSAQGSGPSSMRSTVAGAAAGGQNRGVAPAGIATVTEQPSDRAPSSWKAEARQSAARAPAVPHQLSTSIFRPLSVEVLAARPATPVQARPVIHVTIDRIEVRAPKAEQPSPASRTRTATPSVSLTDYLRRPRNPGGVV